MALRLHATSSTSSPSPRVIPAQVNFLTIYNPTLGDTDETEKDQIVFWAGKDEIGTNRTGRKESKESTEPAKALDEEQAFNEKLRQIGLARGMVQFARYGYLQSLSMFAHVPICIYLAAACHT